MARSSWNDVMDIDSDENEHPIRTTGKPIASPHGNLSIRTRNISPARAINPSTTSTARINVETGSLPRLRPARQLHIDREFAKELRNELTLLKNPDWDGYCDKEGYDEFSNQELADFCQENWGCWLVEWLPESMQPKMTPRTPPAWLLQDLKKNGETLASYQAKVRKLKRSVLDWDIRLLAHLGLLSDFTPGQGDVVLRLLKETVQTRLRKSKAKAKVHELTYIDVKNVIDEAIKRTTHMSN